MSPCPPLFIGTRRRFTACLLSARRRLQHRPRPKYLSSPVPVPLHNSFTSNHSPATRKPSLDSHRLHQLSPPLPSPPLLSQLASTTTSSRIRLRLPSASAPTTQLPSALCRLGRLSLITSSPRPFPSRPHSSTPISSPPPLGRIILQRLMLPRRARR